MKNIFEFFTAKLLLKTHTCVFLKYPFFDHISVNFCPILKIFGTVTIKKTKFRKGTYNMHDLWRFQINISKIGRFIGKKAQKID